MSTSSASAAARTWSCLQATEPTTSPSASSTRACQRRHPSPIPRGPSTPSSRPPLKARPPTCSAPTRRCWISAPSSSGAAGPNPTGRLSVMARKTFTVGWLYPDLMNIYGDRGNILTLLKRAEWRGFDARLVELGRGAIKQMDEVDIFFFGGGQDREQALVYEDLLEFKQPPLEQAVNNGAVILAVCGGYQLLGSYYQTADGERYPGIGMIDVHTEAGKKRFIGDVVVDAEIATLESKTLHRFENHIHPTILVPQAARRPTGSSRAASPRAGRRGGRRGRPHPGEAAKRAATPRGAHPAPSP